MINIVMAKDFLTKYKTILEYTNLGATQMLEVGEDDMQADPMAGGADMGAQDPMAGGAEGADMGVQDPMAGGADAGAMDPMAGSAEGGVEGFAPEGADGPMDGMGVDMGTQDPMAGGVEADVPGAEPMQDGDEVIDVDDLTKSQESAEKKIDKMNEYMI